MIVRHHSTLEEMNQVVGPLQAGMRQVDAAEQRLEWAQEFQNCDANEFAIVYSRMNQDHDFIQILIEQEYGDDLEMQNA
ncbi:hypothetical protein JTB14_029133 [Gonioctena quinquepunctata]|nr:hypothetical protein JTB14_029133 [Gonioctena quinquepunctata]